MFLLCGPSGRGDGTTFPCFFFYPDFSSLRGCPSQRAMEGLPWCSSFLHLTMTCCFFVLPNGLRKRRRSSALFVPFEFCFIFGRFEDPVAGVAFSLPESFHPPPPLFFPPSHPEPGRWVSFLGLWFFFFFDFSGPSFSLSTYQSSCVFDFPISFGFFSDVTLCLPDRNRLFFYLLL